MKRFLLATVTVSIILFVLGGCSKEEISSNIENITTTSLATEVSDKKTEVGTETEDPKTSNIESISTTSLATEVPKNSRFSTRKLAVELEAERSLLSAKDKLIYDEYLSKILNYKEFTVKFESQDFTWTDFYRITDAIYGDYPECWLFLLTSAVEWDSEGNPTTIEVTYEYSWIYSNTFSKDFMNSYLEKIDKACEKIIANMPNDITVAEQYEFLCREICYITEYTDPDFDINSTNYDISHLYLNGPLLNGKGLCQSYAFAYEYLCHKAGLWCTMISGDAHAWNMVMLEDGSTYHVDPTWCDGVFGFDETYFLLTQEEIEQDHSPNATEWVATGV